MRPADVDYAAQAKGMSPCSWSDFSVPMDRPSSDVDRLDLQLPRKRLQTWDFQDDAPNAYQAMCCYAREFLAKPSPHVGRSGPVCPFVPKALKLQCFWIGQVRTSHVKQEDLHRELCKLILDFLPVYHALEPTIGKERKYKTVVFVFPDISTEDAPKFIDDAQLYVKHTVVAQGLMVGEFHALNNATASRNKGFYPLRTPHPALVVRRMVPIDYQFMVYDKYPVPLQVQFLNAFLAEFGDEDITEVRNARDRLISLGSPPEAV